VQFGPLSPETIASVVDKFIFELEQQLADKKVAIRVDQYARAWLAEKGYDAQMGARPMARVIQNQIKKPLANEILFGALVNGGSVDVGVKDGGLSLEYEDRQLH
jgi:ATP-dependent Clp protease ATP-binding subunit ClpA